MDTFKVTVLTLVWTFVVIVMYIVCNTFLFGQFIPIMDDMANNTSFVDMDRYVARTLVIKTAFNIACFILVLIPYAYFFVRMLLKKEQAAEQIPAAAGGW